MRRTKTATFRFYEELNDFLPRQLRKISFPHPFSGRPAIKDSIEALGVPHTEIDLILANGVSVGFDYHVGDGDRIAVYPVFESIDITPIIRLRPRPLRRTRFVLDVQLAKLARLLRMLGFDALHQPSWTHAELIAAERQGRIILTRHRGILKNSRVARGYWIRATQPAEQVREVLHRFDLGHQITPFQRCMPCNGIMEPIAKEQVLERLPEKTKAHYNEFYICICCQRIYWKGSHYARMKPFVDELIAGSSRSGQ